MELKAILEKIDLLSLLDKINWLEISARVLETIIIIVITYVLLGLRGKVIDRIFEITKFDEKKEKTLASLLMSVTKYILWGVCILMLLQTWGTDIKPILAGAGILGLAVGFGAQNLVRDIITGFFVMFEDQFHVGDFVSINNEVSGTIEELGLRMTTIREWSGKKFYISNSEIVKVKNYNRDMLRAIVNVIFPFEENPRKIRVVLEAVCAEFIKKHGEHLLKDASGAFVEPPQIYGVTDITNTDKGAQYTLIALTVPESIWTVEKLLRELIWQACYDNGIQLAYPQRLINLDEGTERQNFVESAN